MTENTMATVENLKVSLRGYALDLDFKNFPISFVNDVRRLCLSKIPTVVVRDVEILENTTQLPHEMLKHRVEMLPINVKPDDTTSIRDAKIELRMKIDKGKDVLTVTSDDFVIQSGKGNLIMKDRDLDTPILFLRMREGEMIHIRGRLALENIHVSQVSTSTTLWNVDPERAKIDRKEYVEKGGDSRVFDSFYIQRSFSRNENGRPNWIKLILESIGVLQAKEILSYAIQILRKDVHEFITDALNDIRREQDQNSYTISAERGGHTVGTLLQEILYSFEDVNFVSYDIPHPLRNTLLLRINSEKSPESLLERAKEKIEEYCSIVEKVL